MLLGDTESAEKDKWKRRNTVMKAQVRNNDECEVEYVILNGHEFEYVKSGGVIEAGQFYGEIVVFCRDSPL